MYFFEGEEKIPNGEKIIFFRHFLRSLSDDWSFFEKYYLYQFFMRYYDLKLAVVEWLYYAISSAFTALLTCAIDKSSQRITDFCPTLFLVYLSGSIWSPAF